MHEGRQHLFFQYVPSSTVWRQDCHWGHLVGDDLVRWTHLPVALAPGDGDDGVWSGCAVADERGPVLLYTSVVDGRADLGRIALARPADPELLTWRKHAGPVLHAPPDVTHFRDPFVWGTPGDWSMLVGAGRGGRGAVLRYTSPDLQAWTPRGVFAEGDGQVWECPQLADLGPTRVLLVSVWDGGALTRVAASCGTERDGTFAGGPWETVGHGGSAYALTTYRDLSGGLAATAWLRGTAEGADWAGMLSLPVRLFARPDGGLGVTWHPDVDTLRREQLDGDFPDGVADLEAELEPGARLRLGPVTITATGDGLDVDGTPVPGEPRLRVVVDRGAIEAWTADGRWIALRIPHLHVRRATLEGGGRLAAWRVEP